MCFVAYVVKWQRIQLRPSQQGRKNATFDFVLLQQPAQLAGKEKLLIRSCSPARWKEKRHIQLRVAAQLAGKKTPHSTSHCCPAS